MPTPCAVTGTLQSLTSGRIAQGKVIFQLTNIGVGNPIGVIGTSIIPALATTIMTAQDGTFSTNLWGNDVINPSNTLYAVTYRDFLGNEIGPILYNITGSTANLNSLAAVSTTVPPVFATIGNLAFAISSQNASFTANSPSTNYHVTTGVSTIVATLISAIGFSGQVLFFKKIDAGAGTLVLTPVSGQMIDGLSTFTLSAQYQYMGLVSNGTTWDIWTRN